MRERIKCLFLTTKCAPFRRWVVRIVKVGESQLPSVFKETPSPLCDYSMRMRIKSIVLSLF